MSRRCMPGGAGIGILFFAMVILLAGCGNPEPPKIRDVQISYWDSSTEDGRWQPLMEGSIAPASPVRILGYITDNTAVVSPRLKMIGERRDVGEEGFTACSSGADAFFECTLSCEEVREGFFACSPPLPASGLIRGDRFAVTMSTKEGKTYSLEVQVAEAQDLLLPASDTGSIYVAEEYRIFRLSGPEGDPNPLLWHLFYSTVQDPALGDWIRLRGGDSVGLGSGGKHFSIGIEEPESGDLEGSPVATWASLTKWNDSHPLDVDPKTGYFFMYFQLFDPRMAQERRAEGNEPAYRFLVSAYDVPDQKKDVGRYSQKSFELTFVPDARSEPPVLDLDPMGGDGEEVIETSKGELIVSGTVESFSGEVKNLSFILSPEGEGWSSSSARVFQFDPDQLSLQGRFSVAIELVSDWDEDGRIDGDGGAEGVTNVLDILALDVQDNWTRYSETFRFVPPETRNQPPVIQVTDTFPGLDKNGEALLPFGEALRVWGRMADDRGQPSLDYAECGCVSEEPLINEDRCPCAWEQGGPLNAAGGFPAHPWEWIAVEPIAGLEETVAVFRATGKIAEGERVEDVSAFEIRMKRDEEEQAYRVSVSALETVGPAVALHSPENGTIIDPHGLLVQAVILPTVSRINQIKALWNGMPRGDPSYDVDLGTFTWDLRSFTIREGDRICIGATSITGHAKVILLEFSETSGGLLVGTTPTSDLAECEEVP